MLTPTLDAVLDAIDAAVPPLGAPPKVTGPGLNRVLRDVAALAATPAPAAPTTYEEVIHFPGQALFYDTVFEPSRLLALTASAGVAKVELCVGDPATAAFQVVPTAGLLAQPLELPVGPLTYRLAFVPGVSYAALKQLIQLK